ncbi:hypothetical protein SAMN05414139_02363 [Burkholderia sp. D7]|nr:hypothetical protein SAMN05414139_02363 [Burkholderia sp. D7]
MKSNIRHIMVVIVIAMLTAGAAGCKRSNSSGSDTAGGAGAMSAPAAASGGAAGGMSGRRFGSEPVNPHGGASNRLADGDGQSRLRRNRVEPASRPMLAADQQARKPCLAGTDIMIRDHTPSMDPGDCKFDRLVNRPLWLPEIAVDPDRAFFAIPAQDRRGGGKPVHSPIQSRSAE